MLPAAVAPMRSRAAVTHQGSQPGSAVWSLGMPRKNLRSTHSVRRTDQVVVRARKDDSTAMSMAELPAPTTTTSRPASWSPER